MKGNRKPVFCRSQPAQALPPATLPAPKYSIPLVGQPSWSDRCCTPLGDAYAAWDLTTPEFTGTPGSRAHSSPVYCENRPSCRSLELSVVLKHIRRATHLFFIQYTDAVTINRATTWRHKIKSIKDFFFPVYIVLFYGQALDDTPFLPARMTILQINHQYFERNPQYITLFTTK